jgi:hypothetical protein
MPFGRGVVTVLGLVGGAPSVCRGRGRRWRAIISPTAGELSGAGRGQFELSITAFGAGLRPDEGL